MDVLGVVHHRVLLVTAFQGIDVRDNGQAKGRRTPHDVRQVPYVCQLGFAVDKHRDRDGIRPET